MPSCPRAAAHRRGRRRIDGVLERVPGACNPGSARHAAGEPGRAHHDAGRKRPRHRSAAQPGIGLRERRSSHELRNSNERNRDDLGLNLNVSLGVRFGAAAASAGAATEAISYERRRAGTASGPTAGSLRASF
jgi:hypothetical protein